MPKVYLIIKEVEDNSCCCYEGDLPCIYREVVDVVCSEEEAETRYKQLSKKEINNNYQKWTSYDWEEAKIPKHVIKYLWDHRDEKG